MTSQAEREAIRAMRQQVKEIYPTLPRQEVNFVAQQLVKAAARQVKTNGLPAGFPETQLHKQANG